MPLHTSHLFNNSKYTVGIVWTSPLCECLIHQTRLKLYRLTQRFGYMYILSYVQGLIIDDRACTDFSVIPILDARITIEDMQTLLSLRLPAPNQHLTQRLHLPPPKQRWLRTLKSTFRDCFHHSNTALTLPHYCFHYHRES
jgi:hypothetical protein